MIDYWRQLDVLPPNELRKIKLTVVGAGGIGSPTVISLAKMGFPEIKVYDDDVVDNHNLPNQLYRKNDVGKPKVVALAEIASDFSDCLVLPEQRLFDKTIRPSGIMVSAVHTMAARKEIWGTAKYNIQVPFYVEARMGIEVLRVNSFKPTDPNAVRWYETKLYDDDHALQAPCTSRAIAYTVFMAASLISSQIKKFVMGEEIKKEIIFDLKNLILVLQ